MILDKMNALSDLTPQEKSVAQFINDHPEAVLNMNINELAKASFTSTSTIIRLCKKMEIKGYADFKVAYARDYQEIKQQTQHPVNRPFEASATLDDIINTLPLVYHQTIDHTKSMLSKNTIIRVTNLMKQAGRIEIYGTGMNYDLARMMAFRFESLNKSCFVYNAAHWEHLKYIEYQKIPTLAILLSNTGKNPMILDAAKQLKQSRVKTLSISTNEDKRLKRLTNENIQVINLKNAPEVKRIGYSMAVQYILDVCITSLMVESLDLLDKVSAELANVRENWNKENK